ncbi:unnamed protein product [Moneuplotes crassus]|uniref:Uncharacterized protein n=1 Tax=Euplotes crassus TaxID=5936 RepID=A0AAD1U486_EUPCR|nr:unnamed protein product [Moneuplotes crassus]
MELPDLSCEKSISVPGRHGTFYGRSSSPTRSFANMSRKDIAIGRNSEIFLGSITRPPPLSICKRGSEAKTACNLSLLDTRSPGTCSQNEDTLEQKLNIFIHPYNHSVTVRNHMTFEQKSKNDVKASEERDIAENKWKFLKDFIFQQNKEQFREVCYNANHDIYDIYNENGTWKKLFKMSKDKKDEIKINNLAHKKRRKYKLTTHKYSKVHKSSRRKSIASRFNSSMNMSSLQPRSSLLKPKDFWLDNAPEITMNCIKEEKEKEKYSENSKINTQKVFKKFTEVPGRKTSKGDQIKLKLKKVVKKKFSFINPEKMKTLGIKVKNYSKKPDSSKDDNKSHMISTFIKTKDDSCKNFKTGKFERIQCKQIGEKRKSLEMTSTFNKDRIRHSISLHKRHGLFSPPCAQQKSPCFSPIFSKMISKNSGNQILLHQPRDDLPRTSDQIPHFSTIIKTNIRDFNGDQALCSRGKDSPTNAQINEFKEIRKLYNNLNRNIKQNNLLLCRYRELRNRGFRNGRNHSIS